MADLFTSLDTLHDRYEQLTEQLGDTSYFLRGFAPTALGAYPRALSQLDFAGARQNRGGIGCADYMPPPLLGARGVISGGFRMFKKN